MNSLSICIASLGDLELLNKTIRSFYIPGVEVVVLDLHTELPDLSEFNSNIKVIESYRSLGSSQAKQLAVSNSTGDIILLLDAHMVPVNSDWYETIMDFMENHDKGGFILVLLDLGFQVLMNSYLIEVQDHT